MRFQWLLLYFVISLSIIYNLYNPSGTHSLLQINMSVFNNFETNPNLCKAQIRRKRFLIFHGSGVLKMVLGFSEPVNLLDKFRQMAINYAFHLQYTPPTVPVYWWTYFYNSTAWSNMRDIKVQQRHKKSAKDMKYFFNYDPYSNFHKKFVQVEYKQPVILHDTSRNAMYKAIETVYNSRGFPGEKCLLRTICEISSGSFYEQSSLEGVINAIFTPSVDNIDGKFMRAKQLGSQGAKCKKIYWSCENGIKWFLGIIKYSRK